MVRVTKKGMLTLMVLAVFLFWLSHRTMKIIAVHQDDTYSEVLVKDYPLTSKGKIGWWLKNKEMLKEKYNIPRPDKDGRYHVILWDFDEGYKELDKYDRLCFDDMPPPKNCVDKNTLMIISHSKDNVTQFTVGNEYYILQDDGVTVKVRPY
ncbi:DUF943 family protein [Pseudomonas graminis]